MGTIVERTTKNGTRRYQARIRLTNYPVVSDTFGSREEAVRFIQETEHMLKTGNYLPGDRAIAQVMDLYLEEHSQVRNGTRRSYLNAMRVIAEILGAVPICKLTRGHVQSLKQELVTRYSAVTARTYFRIFLMLMTFSVARGMLVRSPVGDVKAPAAPPPIIRALTKEEAARLLAALVAHPRLYAIAFLALTTGMRKGELLMLRHDQVDLMHERIHLLPGDTKGNAARSVVLVEAAVEVLKEELQVAAVGSDALVFAPRKGARVRSIEREWNAVKEKAQLPTIRFHDLRHTIASWMLMDGATMAEVGQVLGHKSPASTAIYAHLAEGHSRARLEATLAVMLPQSSRQSAKNRTNLPISDRTKDLNSIDLVGGEAPQCGCSLETIKRQLRELEATVRAAFGHPRGTAACANADHDRAIAA